jgi:hypothetical protein
MAARSHPVTPLRSICWRRRFAKPAQRRFCLATALGSLAIGFACSHRDGENGATVGRGTGVRPPMIAVYMTGDGCESLAHWVADLDCASLHLRPTSRLSIVERASDAIARTPSPDLVVKVDGEVAMSKGQLPRWEPDLPAGADVLMAGVADMPEPQASAVARAWSMSQPPEALRGSLRRDKGGYRIELELITKTEADAAQVAKTIGKLVATDVVWQTLALGDFSPLASNLALTHKGAVARASITLSPADVSALVARIRLVGWQELPADGSQALWLYVHPDGIVSTASAYAPMSRLDEFLRMTPPQASGIVVEYPAGTSHETITEVVAAIRVTGHTPWVSPKAGEPRMPALVAFDARIPRSVASRVRPLMDQCKTGSADACWELGTFLESHPTIGEAQRAYRRACGLGHRGACSRTGSSPR